MMLKFKYFSEPFDIKNAVTYLVLENKTVYRNVITALYCENADDLFILSENFTPLDFSKKVLFLNDILNFSISDRKLLNKVNSDLARVANEKYVLETSEIIELLSAFGDKLSYEFDFDFSFCEEFDATVLIKFLGFYPRLDGDSPAEKLIRFFKLCGKYLGVRIFFISNLKLCFSNDEIELINEALKLFNVCVIDIENFLCDAGNKDEAVFVLDNDLCEIVDN